MTNKAINYLVLLLLFLLPWQTRWIYYLDFLSGVQNEYGTLSFYGTEILLWTVVVLFVGNTFLNKEFISLLKARKLSPPVAIRLGILLLVIAWLGLIWFYSANHEVVSQFYNRLSGVVALGIILFVQIAKNSLPKIWALLALWLSGVVQGGLGAYQFLLQGIAANKWLGLSETLPSSIGVNVIETAGERWLRAYGSLGGPNPLGIYLVVILILGFILYYFYRNSKVRLFIIFGNLIIFTGLFFTFSRGAWLSGLVGGVVFILTILFGKKSEVKTRAEKICLLSRLVIPFLLLFLVLNFLFSPLVQTRFGSEGRLEKRSLRERGDQIIEWKMVFESNWFIGTGPGNYLRALAHIDDGPQRAYALPVHNIYLLILAEMGSIFFMGFIIGLVILLVKVLKNNPLYLALIVSLAIAGLFEHWLWSLFPGLIFSAVIATLSLAPDNTSKMA
ncbi:MAG TPA: O-antigen ligase family protein [Patescibacteria group bacterium]|nr:O-antigen ligase family protein [Patescibacteria group bacterium]